MNKTEEFYDWQQANPSEEVSLPFVLSLVLNPGAECGWMAERSYASEEMFVEMEKMYRNEYPLLFQELEALAVLKAHTPQALMDAEVSMAHYYRGAIMAIRALEASNVEARFTDLTYSYLKKLRNLDIFDLIHWLNFMIASTNKQTEQIRGFIEVDYDLIGDEPYYVKQNMIYGARNAYILLVHNRACLRREQEIAWYLHDNELIEGTDLSM